jgi:ketosteroid isomerase-like protein
MHPNAQVVMRGFQAFAEGDMATMKELFADDATWHGGGRNKWSGDYTGPDSILRMMGGLGEEATVDNQPHAILADDDHVVVLINSSLSRKGKSFSGNTVFVFHVSDGKVAEAWTIPGDPYGLDEFWAD